MRRKLRLRNREDYSRVYRGGRSFANGQFVVYWSKQPSAQPFRVGISASKKIGNAVVRNRMRRLVKEIVRHMEGQIVPYVDFILIVRKPAVTMSYAELERSIKHVLRKAGLLKDSKVKSPRSATMKSRS
ncbi:ribonuclease P protein component [Paenibacillus montaniterrae]|uniref:Ribonuclease P protein component n=1 Tax=Paenibacillus montaniterrae TaxID=429341 RepID=A0A919YS53_9BACL|nr:ribonuclease P protein component [Paenibacillus montaniterrae]GIP18445.1 ribonuclease P protein component [Paenibacillus montaniterrae]